MAFAVADCLRATPSSTFQQLCLVQLTYKCRAPSSLLGSRFTCKWNVALSSDVTGTGHGWYVNTKMFEIRSPMSELEDVLRGSFTRQLKEIGFVNL